jgi:hypothetical protein
MNDINIEIKKREDCYFVVIQPTGTEVAQQGKACMFPDLLTLVLGLGMQLQDLDSGRSEFVIAEQEPQTQE